MSRSEKHKRRKTERSLGRLVGNELSVSYQPSICAIVAVSDFIALQDIIRLLERKRKSQWCVNSRIMADVAVAKRCSNPGCDQPGTNACRACKTASYCGVNCQTADWPSHKEECDGHLRKVGMANSVKLQDLNESRTGCKHYVTARSQQLS